MAAKEEGTGAQKQGGYNWVCSSCRGRLGDKFYYAAHWSRCVLVCAKCAEKAAEMIAENEGKVKEDVLKECEARDLEFLKQTVNVNTNFDKKKAFCCMCPKDKKARATHKLFLRGTDYKLPVCEEHGKERQGLIPGAELEQLGEDEKMTNIKEILLVHEDYPQDEKEDPWDLIHAGKIPSFPFELEVPEFEWDKQHRIAKLHHDILVQLVSFFLKRCVQSSLTLTNVVHFFRLQSEINKLDALFHFPQEGGMLEVYGAMTGSGGDVVSIQHEPAYFTPGEPCSFTVVFRERVEDYEPLIVGPTGFFVKDRKDTKEGYTWKVTFTLEEDELTKTTAAFGSSRSDIHIGCKNNKTKRETLIPVTVVTQPQ